MTNEFDDNDPNLSEMDQGEPGMPIGVGDFGGASGFTAGEEPGAVKRHAAGALLLTAVVVVAVVGLFSMRTLTRASAATEAPSDVEQSIERFLDVINGGKSGAANMSKGAESVLDVLSESYTHRQVSLSDVQRNPFIIFERVDAPATPQQEAVDPVIEQRRQRAAQFERAAERLRLGSVLMGSRPLANINNQVLRVGDSLTIQSEGVTFVVVAIESGSVELVAEDDELGVRHPVTISIRRDR